MLARQAVGLAFLLLTVALFLLEQGVFYGTIALALWVYVMGYYVFRAQTSPHPLVLRLLLAFLVLFFTLLASLLPWLYEDCDRFDPSMKTSYGQSFSDFYMQFWLRVPFSYILAFMAVYALICDHKDSVYVRQSIRCALYFWLGLILKNLYTAIAACEGGDRDQDGVRDRITEHSDLALMCANCSNTIAFLGDMWCLQLLMERLMALEEAFGESLPCSRPIFWLSWTIWLAIVVMAVTSSLSTLVALVCSLVATAALLCLMALTWRAYGVPLRALRRATDGDRRHAMAMPLQRETRFALRVIRTARAATVVSGLTMAWYLSTFGLMNHMVVEVIQVYQHGQLFDLFANAMSLLLMSITSFTLPVLRRPPKPVHMAPKTTGAWQAKVAELAGRRIMAGQLLELYAQLGSGHMAHFRPEVSTTNDVVRQAIIPMSRWGARGRSLADALEVSQQDRRPVRMVTHHWANRFRDLVAAVLADAMQLSRWDGVAKELDAGHVESLRQRLEDCGAERWQYWICAICINQHASICGNAMGTRDTVTGELLPTCDCETPKFFNDQPTECELNKFDHMMNYLYLEYGHHFLQVVAIDRHFQLFSRAWCVAELVEASNSHLDQHLMLHSPDVLEKHSGQLENLKVEECHAAREEDKDLILSKIGTEADIERFNRQLRDLLLGSKGLLAGWLDGQKLLQEVGEIAARAKARCREMEARSEAPKAPDGARVSL